MLKVTKTKETIVFFVTFLSLVAFQLRGTRAPWLRLWTLKSKLKQMHGEKEKSIKEKKAALAANFFAVTRI